MPLRYGELPLLLHLPDADGVLVPARACCCGRACAARRRGRWPSCGCVSRPGIVTDPAAGRICRATLATYFDPNFVSVLKYENEIIVFLVVGAGLALLVRRSRILVAERAEAERERVEPGALLLAQGRGRAGRARRAAGPRAPPGRRRALRRPGRLHHAGRGHDARRGDGDAARLPRPDGGRGLPPRRAAWRSSSATRCWRPSASPTWARATPPTRWPARAAMLAALAAWNRERARAGAAAAAHGAWACTTARSCSATSAAERSMAFATVGDTVNVTSRLQTLTRAISTPPRGERRAGRRRRARGRRARAAGRAAGRGPHALRGRDTPIEIWAG